jgi:GNAT superfamily N-acetyltransferase
VLSIRKATAEDYPDYCRLFPELLVDDPIPSLNVWTTALAPCSLIAQENDLVLGYCYFQEYVDAGYIRNIIVAPASQRRGIGKALMNETGAVLRSHGKSSWRLNVRSNNQAAIALYTAVGMRPKYLSISMRFSWSELDQLPLGGAVVRTLTEPRDSLVEQAFEIPRGQLPAARAMGRQLFEAVDASSETVGVSVFDTKFSGAFPFRVKTTDVAKPLLLAMRQLTPSDEHVCLVAEDDQKLAQLLKDSGATVRDEIIHMVGHF